MIEFKFSIDIYERGGLVEFKANTVYGEEIEISHCKRCGRKLTNKESITRGYGPTCYRASQQTEKKEKHKQDCYTSSNVT